MALGVYNSAAFTSASGVAVAAGAAVEVRREVDGALASIFEDRAGATPISQPGFVADASGRFTCYMAAIEEGYSVEVDSGAESHTLRNVQVSDPTNFGISISDAANAAAVLSLLVAWSTAQTQAAIKNAVAAGATILNGYLDWSVAGSVLTVAVKTMAGADPSAGDPVTVVFRSATPGDGAPVAIDLVAATSIAVNDTATLGTINSTAFRLWCVAFNDAGTVRLALINCLAGAAPNFNIYPLAAWGIASSTLEDNASDSAHVFYSAGAGVTSKAYGVLGYATWESGLATAGTWSGAPTREQVFGPGVPLPGARFNQVREQTGALATGTTVIPLDDTIPQSGEGDEYIDVVHAATSAANITELEGSVNLFHSAAGSALMAHLIQDSVANAIASAFGGKDSTSWSSGVVPIKHQMRSPAASTTYNLRAGSNTAGTTNFNGHTGGRMHGGVLSSYLSATEIMA
jgi:hypothetical protein